MQRVINVVDMEFYWSAYVVPMELRRVNVGTTSAEGRDNLGTTLLKFWSKNGRNLAFAASIACFTTKNTCNQN